MSIPPLLSYLIYIYLNLASFFLLLFLSKVEKQSALHTATQSRKCQVKMNE